MIKFKSYVLIQIVFILRRKLLWQEYVNTAGADLFPGIPSVTLTVTFVDVGSLTFTT